jgi:hypothetical protein
MAVLDPVKVITTIILKEKKSFLKPKTTKKMSGRMKAIFRKVHTLKEDFWKWPTKFFRLSIGNEVR